MSANVHYQWNATDDRRASSAALVHDRRRGRHRGAGRYRVTMNSFLADGGDGYTVFRDQCTAPLGGEVDIDAFARYFVANSPLAPSGPEPDREGRP